MILVSSCLLGLCTRYDGQGFANEKIVACVQANKDKFIPVCPEQLGGLPTPRAPIELVASSDKVRAVTAGNVDCTDQVKKGTQQVLDLAKLMDIKVAIMKEKSPTCGVNKIYDGSFSGTVVAGQGFATRALIDNNIIVFADSEITEEILIKLII